MKICVCICTYNRNELLSRLLERLQKIMLFNNTPGVELELLVIDNKCSNKTKEICQYFAAQYPVPLYYLTEGVRGISQARNTAVNAALERQSDFVAFIDDDDMPSRNWLEKLWAQQRSTGADIVVGSWILATDAPEWARYSSIFKSLNTLQVKHGSRTDGLPWMASTCNVLIASSLLDRARKYDFVFDPGLSKFGGEDKDFFVRAVATGATITSCKDSVVVRHHEPERYSVHGLFERGFKNGCSRLRKLRGKKGPFSALKRVIFSAVKLLVVILSFPFLVFSKKLIMHQVYRLGKSSGAIYYFFTGKGNSYYVKSAVTSHVAEAVESNV